MGCVLVLSPAAFGHSDRGTITGTVSDPAGGPAACADLDV
jgi:hypothetical protein